MTFIFFGIDNKVLLLVLIKPGFPGCTSNPKVSPKQTLKTDVRMKYTIVRTATLPFLLMSKLAAPEK